MAERTDGQGDGTGDFNAYLNIDQCVIPDSVDILFPIWVHRNVLGERTFGMDKASNFQRRPFISSGYETEMIKIVQH